MFTRLCSYPACETCHWPDVFSAELREVRANLAVIQNVDSCQQIVKCALVSVLLL
jgi:hypothetical protein